MHTTAYAAGRLANISLCHRSTCTSKLANANRQSAVEHVSNDAGAKLPRKSALIQCACFPAAHAPACVLVLHVLFAFERGAHRRRAVTQASRCTDDLRMLWKRFEVVWSGFHAGLVTFCHHRGRCMKVTCKAVLLFLTAESSPQCYVTNSYPVMWATVIGQSLV